MATRLEQHLLNIERTLSGDAPVDPSLNTAQDRLAWHLNKIEELLADVGSQIGKLSYEVVDTLPATGEPGIVYFVRVSTKKNQNKSDEYLWVNGDFEKIGSTDIDLSYVQTINGVEPDENGNVTIAVGADWNANEGEAGYVKNRTHWEDEDGTVHKLDKKFIEVISEEDFLTWLNEAQVVELVTSSAGEVYTTNNNEIYVL